MLHVKQKTKIILQVFRYKCDLATVLLFLCLSQKLMALMNPKEEEEEQEEVSRMQTDVTDEEMALRYKQTEISQASCSRIDLQGFCCDVTEQDEHWNLFTSYLNVFRRV